VKAAWADQREELETELRKVKRNFDKLKGEIIAKEEKIEFYEDNYSSLIAELKNELQTRANLIEEYQTMPKDITREQLSSMIFDLKKKCKANAKTTAKKIDELKEVADKIVEYDQGLKIQNMEIMTKIGEGENKKKKGDDTYDTLRDVFKKLCSAYDSTKDHLTKYGDLKLQAKSLEDDIMDLKKSNYKETAEKLKTELDVIISA